MSARDGLRRSAATTGLVLGEVLVRPVQEGRLRDTGWPPGLRTAVVVSLLGYLVLVLAALLAAVWRGAGGLLAVPPQATFPAAGLAVVVLGLVLSLAALVTASLAMRWWVRLAVWLVLAAIAGRPSDAVPTDLTTLVWQDVVSLVALAGLVVLLVLPRRRVFRLTDYTLAVLLVGVLVAVAVLGRTLGSYGEALDYSLNSLALALPLVFWLATPAAMVAGAALVELSCRASAWLVTGVHRQVTSAGHRRPALLLGVAVSLLLLARLVQVGWQVATATETVHRWGPTWWGVGETVLVLAVAVGVLRLARPPDRSPPGVEDLLDGWSRRSLLLALVLSGCFFGPLLLGALLAGLLVPGGWVLAVRDVGQPYQLLWAAGLSLVLLTVLVVRAVRRHDPTTAVLGTTLVGYTAISGINQLARITVSQPAILLTVSLVVVLAALWLLARRRLSAQTGVALATIMGLSLAWEHRDVLTEPLTAALALSGAGAGLLAGLVWRLLTDNGWTRSGSERVPIQARVLVALAGGLFVAVSAAVTALHGGTFPLSLDQAESAGDTNLGLALVLGLTAVVLGQVLDQGRRPRRAAQPPVDRVSSSAGAAG